MADRMDSRASNAMIEQPTDEQMRIMVETCKKIVLAVEDIYRRLADVFRKVFTPSLMLAIHYALLMDTPKWRILRRWSIKRRIKELEIVTGVYDEREALRQELRKIRRS